MARIAQITPQGTITLQSGEFFKSQITLDDGKSGEVLAKTADRWKVGDEVEAEVMTNQYGTRLKLSKPDNNSFSGGGSKGGMSPDKEKRITFLSCLSSAATFFQQREASPETLIATALQFTNAAFSLGETEEKLNKPTPQQPPF